MTTDAATLLNALMSLTCGVLLIELVLRDRADLLGELRRGTRWPHSWLPVPSARFFLALLPLTTLAAALAITAFNIGTLPPAGPKPAHTAITIGAMGLLGLSLGLRFARKTTMAARITAALGDPLGLAWTITAHLAVVGGVGVAHLAVYPSAVSQQPMYSWVALDKRWLIATYLLAIVIVVAPAFLCRLLQTTPPPDVVADHLARSRARGVAGVLVSVLVAMVVTMHLFHPAVLSASQQRLDQHELVHLGSLLRILQGHAPYVDAETQYGPGHQLSTYWLMRRTEFSLYGFRIAQVLLNFVSAVIVYSLVFVAFPWWIGTLFVLSSTWVSTLVMNDFFGWTVWARWMGAFIVGAGLPLVIARPRRMGARSLGAFSVGAAWAVLSWLASENLSAGLLTFALVMTLSWSMGAIGLRPALNVSLMFFAGFLSVCAVVLTTVHSLADLPSLARLYLRTSALVSAGVNNTYWNPVGTGPSWFLAYGLTPFVYIATGLAVLYVRRGASPEARCAGDRLQFMGMWSAGVVLHVNTMFRSDRWHFLGPSLALTLVLVLWVTTFPSLISTRMLPREALRVAMVLLILLIYPDPRPSVKRLALTESQHLTAASRLVDALAHGGRGEATPEDRLGFAPPPPRCCSGNDWTSAQLNALMADVAHATGGRPTVVYELRGTFPAAVYFFADLTTATAITEPMMSVWTQADVARWTSQVERSNVACLVTTSSDAPFVQQVLRRFGSFSTHDRSVPAPYTIYCRDERHRT